MFGKSIEKFSKVFDNVRKAFGNIRKKFGIYLETSGKCQKAIEKSSLRNRNTLKNLRI